LPAPASGPGGEAFRTGRDGAFHFDGLAPGPYLAEASAERFMAAFRDRLEVEPGGVLEVRIELWAGGATLTGRVLDAGGGFIPRARLQATSYALNARGTHDARAFQTDADGEGRVNCSSPKGGRSCSWSPTAMHP
jgi:hypothetical protein